MKKYFLFSILLLVLLGAHAQNYTVGVQSVIWTDSSRSNRSVPVEFHYPGTNTSIASDSFGFVVFGHGFDIPISAYYNYADSLASHGYIVALTSNEGGLSPSHPNLAQDLLYIYNMMISQSIINSSSPLYHHVKSRGAIAGHSMGGGCAVLSCQYSDTATCYWTLSEATTTPSSITAAAHMYKPYLSFAGSSDCIAPPSTNQIPTYDSAHSICKTFIEIKNATHCQYASGNSTCVLGEELSGCSSTSLSEVAQTDSALSFIYPYLDYYLNGNCNAWTQFENRYAADPNDLLMQSCNNIIPVNQAISGAPSFCSGSLDTLSASPVGFSYNWSNSSTNTAINVSSAGTYSLTVSNGTCSVTATPKTVTENFPPAAPSSITAPDTVCSDISNINISVINDITATSYNWILPTGFSISTGNNTHAISAISGSSSGTISVTAQNSCGISSSVQKNIIVNPSGLAAPGAIWGDSFPCVGQPVQYAIGAVSGANSYVWNYPNGWTLVSGGTSDTLNLNTGTASGTVTVQAVNGCGQGEPSSLNVTANSAPLAGNIVGDTLVCSGQTVQYIIPAVNGATTYLWGYPNGWTLLSPNSTDTLKVSAGAINGNITVQVINVCGQSSPSLLSVAIIPPPTTGAITGTDSVCSNANGALAFSLPSASGADSIYWSVPNGWNIVSGQGTPNITINNNGSGGIVSANAYNACSSANAAPFNLEIIDTPQATIAQSHDTLTTGPGSGYQWYFNGALISNATAQNYVATQNGNYSVAISNAAGCTGISAAYNYVYLSIADVADEKSIDIFPNPSSDGIFWIALDNTFFGSDLSLFDVLGRKIFQHKIIDNKMLIDLSNLSSGVYIATFETDGVVVKKSQLVK